MPRKRLNKPEANTTTKVTPIRPPSETALRLMEDLVRWNFEAAGAAMMARRPAPGRAMDYVMDGLELFDHLAALYGEDETTTRWDLFKRVFDDPQGRGRPKAGAPPREPSL